MSRNPLVQIGHENFRLLRAEVPPTSYLDAPVGQGRLSPGLGARHAAALAITTVTDATAVVISASSGTVSVYDGGETVLKLERAYPGS